MGEFQGVSGKEKWNLIAGKVDGKTRQECLMHSKLLDARKAEGGQGQSQGQAQGQGQGQGQGQFVRAKLSYERSPNRGPNGNLNGPQR